METKIDLEKLAEQLIFNGDIKLIANTHRKPFDLNLNYTLNLLMAKIAAIKHS